MNLFAVLTVFSLLCFTSVLSQANPDGPQEDPEDSTDGPVEDIEVSQDEQEEVPKDPITIKWPVEMVKQKYKPDTNKNLTQQITKELKASHLYQAYASYFQRADVSLPGVQNFFAKAADEERQHAQMLIDYVNQRGGYVEFEDVELLPFCKDLDDEIYYKNVWGESNEGRLCICSFVASTKRNAGQSRGQGISNVCEDRKDGKWKDALWAFKDALVAERFVNEQLLNLHKLADKNQDAHLSHLLEHVFLEEQVKSINDLGHYVTRLSRFEDKNYRLGEYMFDQSLQ